mgnify:CR=1 FL=1
MSPFISVILPVRNGMPWLEEAVESILLQRTNAGMEMLVINDGSDDDTNDYLASIRDERVRIVHFEEGRGIVNALNTGIALARGDYIARMDADDVSMPDRLVIQQRFLEANPEYGLVATDIEAFSHLSASGMEQQLIRIETWYNEGHSDDELRAILPIGNPLNHPSVMFRKSVLAKVGGYRNHYEYAEDYDLFVRLSRITKMAKIPRKLLRYRVHPNQISSSRAEEQRKVDAEIKARLLIDDYLPAGGKLLIWGAGGGGQKICCALRNAGVNIVGFIDNNSRTWGTELCGVPVIGGEQAIDLVGADYVVIATSVGRSYAEQYLSGKGLRKMDDYLAVW